MFVFFFVGFQWIIIFKLYFSVILCFEISSNISSNHFLNLVLHMSWITIFHRIISPSMNHRHDKVTYILCIFKCTLLGGCRRSTINLSNVCPCVLMSMDCECFGALVFWCLWIVNVLEVFDSNIWWWHWKFLEMGTIGVTF